MCQDTTRQDADFVAHRVHHARDPSIRALHDSNADPHHTAAHLRAAPESGAARAAHGGTEAAHVDDARADALLWARVCQERNLVVRRSLQGPTGHAPPQRPGCSVHDPEPFDLCRSWSLGGLCEHSSNMYAPLSPQPLSASVLLFCASRLFFSKFSTRPSSSSPPSSQLSSCAAGFHSSIG